MKIAELVDKKGGVNIELKVIYDQMKEQNRWGKRMKTVIVVDADAEGSEKTALLDLYDDDVDNYTFRKKLRVVNGYAKKIKTDRGEQMLITYGFADGKLVGHYEKIKED